MKTLEQVSNQMKNLQSQFVLTNDKSQRRSLQAHYSKLRPILLVLQSGMTEDALRNQLFSQEQKLEVITKRINSQVEELERSGSYGAYGLRKRLESEYNIKDIEARIELLRDILN